MEPVGEFFNLIVMTAKEFKMNKALFTLLASLCVASPVLGHGLGVPTGGAANTGAAAAVPTAPAAPTAGGAAAQPAGAAQAIMFQGGGYVPVPAYPGVGGGVAEPGGPAAVAADEEEGGAAAPRTSRRSLATKKTGRTLPTVPTKGVAFGQ